MATTFVAGLRNTGIVAPMVLEGPINGSPFQDYVEEVLVPELHPGDVVVLNNLDSLDSLDSLEGLCAAIGRIIDTFTLAACDNYFAAIGYDAH